MWVQRIGKYLKTKETTNALRFWNEKKYMHIVKDINKDKTTI